MSPRERAFVLWAIKYTAGYAVIALLSVTLAVYVDREELLVGLIPFHFLGMVQNVVAFGLTLRDLYVRPFPGVWWKWGWFFLIVYTGGIGWLVYIFKHALKPRPLPNEFQGENAQAFTAS